MPASNHQGKERYRAKGRLFCRVPPVSQGKKMNGKKNENKKIIILSLVLLVAVFVGLSACKGDKSDGGETVVVTDENGVPVTD